MTKQITQADVDSDQARIEEVGSRFLRGDSQRTIAESLGISQPTVSRLLAEFLRGLQATFSDEMERCRAVELGKICELERAAWAGFEETKNSKFLGVVANAVAIRCRILGVEKPVKAEVTLNHIKVLSRDEMFLAVRERLAAFRPN